MVHSRFFTRFSRGPSIPSGVILVLRGSVDSGPVVGEKPAEQIELTPQRTTSTFDFLRQFLVNA